MNKAYTRIVWENEPSTDTPLNETNLNKMDVALDTIDDRVVAMDGLIQDYTFNDSSTIDFTASISGIHNTVTADIKDGSITGQKLQPNYLADCQQAKTDAEGYATSAGSEADQSEAWSTGEIGGIPVPSSAPQHDNNAKYYSEQAADIATSLLNSLGINVVGQKLVFGVEFENQYDIAVSGTKLIITERS